MANSFPFFIIYFVSCMKVLFASIFFWSSTHLEKMAFCWLQHMFWASHVLFSFSLAGKLLQTKYQENSRKKINFEAAAQRERIAFWSGWRRWKAHAHIYIRIDWQSILENVASMTGKGQWNQSELINFWLIAAAINLHRKWVRPFDGTRRMRTECFTTIHCWERAYTRT